MEKCLKKLGCNLCSCAFDKDGVLDIEALLEIEKNIETHYWVLHYSSLEKEAGRHLCLIAECKKCGKLYCRAFDFPEEIVGKRFLFSVYRCFYLFVAVFKPEFAAKHLFHQEFVKLFEEDDHPIIEQWLALPENQNMYEEGAWSYDDPQRAGANETFKTG